MTPEVAGLMIEKVKSGDEPPFALLCFTTQDRLSLQNHTDQLIGYIRQLRSIVDFYRKRPP
jgi:hypothetical protein